VNDQMTHAQRMMIGDRTAGERLLASQKLEPGSPYLFGEEPPTPNQISAVLHALADHGLQSHMNSEVVLALGTDRAELGGTWKQDSAHGRFFQAMGDSVATWPDLDAKAKADAEAAEDERRWNTAVDWLLNHGKVAIDLAPVFFAYTDGLITEDEMRAEATDDEDTEGMPVSIFDVIEQRRAAAEADTKAGA
jgi:hypothetical protein